MSCLITLNVNSTAKICDADHTMLSLSKLLFVLLLCVCVSLPVHHATTLMGHCSCPVVLVACTATKLIGDGLVNDTLKILLVSVCAELACRLPATKHPGI